MDMIEKTVKELYERLRETEKTHHIIAIKVDINAVPKNNIPDFMLNLLHEIEQFEQ